MPKYVWASWRFGRGSVQEVEPGAETAEAVECDNMDEAINHFRSSFNDQLRAKMELAVHSPTVRQRRIAREEMEMLLGFLGDLD